MATANSTRPGRRARATESRLTNTQRTGSALDPARDAVAAAIAREHHDALEQLQQEVLDALAVCSVVASALDPASSGEMIRLLGLAQQRLTEVSERVLRIAGEIAGVPHG